MENRWESIPRHRRSSPHGWTFAIQRDILFQIQFFVRLNLKRWELNIYLIGLVGDTLKNG
jgi:hypothetical protein